ncbi:MAG: efflux RND transporter permease subunit [Firmicutes bacterium]|nr:efflux RND transporter permease subunit [Bacillota bacterium]
MQNIELENKADKDIKENGLTRFGVGRPHTVFVMIMIILMLGFFAFTRLTLELFPNMNVPMMAIVVNSKTVDGEPEWHAGDENETAEEKAFRRVTDPIQRALQTVSGIDMVTSTTTQGMVMVMIEFSSDRNLNFGMLDVQTAVLGVLDYDAAGYNRPRFLDFDISLLPMMQFSSNFMLGFNNDQLNDLTPSETPRTVGGGFYTVGENNQNTLGRWYQDNVVGPLQNTTGVADVGSPFVRNEQTGRFTIRGVSYVNDGTSNQRRFMFSITRAVDTPTVDASQNVKATLADVPGAFSYTIVMDQAEAIEDSIFSVLESLLIGALMSVVILLIFLRNIKLTVAVGISIPVSVVGTFVLMYFMGIGLNMVSMGGLALAVGLLVDNSIIVAENIFRLRKKGIGRKEAAIKGASQIIGAVIAATLTTVAVFVPMFFVTGLIMEVFMDMVYVIIFALLASLLSAVVFLPSIISSFNVKERAEKSINPPTPMEQLALAAPAAASVSTEPARYNAFVRTYRTLEKGHAGATKGVKVGYSATLNWALKFRWIVLVLALALFVGSGCLLWFTRGWEMMPSEDTGSFSVSVVSNMVASTIVPADVRQQQAHVIMFGNGTTEEGIFNLIERELGGYHDSTAISFGGGGFMGFDGGGNISITVNLTEGRRTLETVDAQAQVEAAIRTYLTTHNYIITDENDVMQEVSRFASDVTSSSGMMAGMFGSNISVRISHADRDDLLAATLFLQEELLKINGVEFVRHDLVLIPEFETVPMSDPRPGIPINFFEKMVATGNRIQATMNQTDRRYTATLTIQTEHGSVTNQINDVVTARLDQLFEEHKNGVLEGVTPLNNYTEQLMDTLVQMLIAIAIGMVLMYLVMVAIFRSFKNPFIIIFTVPIAFTGGFFLLWATGGQLTIPALVGLMVLMGVVVNNGIVLVDYINQARRNGARVRDAVIDSAKSRVRPIVMMALTTILAMMPLAIGYGTGAQMMQPLAIITVGGLAYAMIVSLLGIPALYMILNKDIKTKEEKDYIRSGKEKCKLLKTEGKQVELLEFKKEFKAQRKVFVENRPPKLVETNN